MIYYGKLFDLMKAQGKNTTHIRVEKIISQDALGKLRKGTWLNCQPSDIMEVIPKT